MEQRRRTASKFFPVYQPALNLDFRGGVFASGLTFTRNSIATFVDSTGLRRVAAANQPRFAFDPVTLQAKNLMVECEGRINVLLQSDDVTNAAWGVFGTQTVTPGQADPSGGVTAVLVDDTDVVNASQRFQAVTVANDAVTRIASFDIKPGTATSSSVRLSYAGGTPLAYSVTVDWATLVLTPSGAATAADVFLESPINGFYRLSVRGANNTTGNTTCTAIVFPAGLVAANTGTATIAGADLQVGSFPTSHIPTTAAPVTREADAILMPTAELVRVLNPWGGTAVWSGSLTDVSIDHRLFELNTNSSLNSLHLRNTTSANIRVAVITGGVTQAAQNTPNTLTSNSRFKTAVTWTTNNCSAVLNAGAVITDSPPFATPAITQLQLMTGAFNVQPACGFVDYFRYWQQDADPRMLQFLTGSQYD